MEPQSNQSREEKPKVLSQTVGLFGRRKRQKQIVGALLLGTVFLFCKFSILDSGNRPVKREAAPPLKHKLHKTAAVLLLSRGREDICVHPEVDFFDPEIMDFYKNQPVRECNKFAQIYSSLKDGLLLPTWPELHDCWGRCQIFKNSTSTNTGTWYHTSKEYVFPCDVVLNVDTFDYKSTITVKTIQVETRCSDKGKDISQAFDYFMHTQIVEVEMETPKFEVPGKKYDVYFLIVDSTGHTQMFRNMNKTNNFLLNELEGIAFPYLNRIGHNSRPNGFSWFFGKLSDRIDRDMFNLPSIEPEPGWERTESCGRKLDNETMLLREFRDYGYMVKGKNSFKNMIVQTNHVAEYIRTVDYGCQGVDDPITHHTYTPYFHTTETESKLKLFEDHCLLPHQHAIDYFDKFVNSYQDKPKMGFMWLTNVGHETEIGSTDADPHFYEFFTKNKHILENSFVIFGGDHGLRSSDAVHTKVGSLDFNNPALIISPPKELRNNVELMETLRENSMELQTHFDTRSTLLDILKYQPSADFNDRSMMKIEGEFGHSFLRIQPKPRTCQTLPIPIEYCICDNYPKKDLMKQKPAKAKLIGIETINRINTQLNEGKVAHKCRKWTFQKTEKLQQLSVGKTDNFVGTIIGTNDIGRVAKFYVYLSRKNGLLEILSLDRLDRYGNNGHCVHMDLQAICECY